MLVVVILHLSMLILNKQSFWIVPKMMSEKRTVSLALLLLLRQPRCQPVFQLMRQPRSQPVFQLWRQPRSQPMFQLLYQRKNQPVLTSAEGSFPVSGRGLPTYSNNWWAMRCHFLYACGSIMNWIAGQEVVIESALHYFIYIYLQWMYVPECK